MDEKSVSIAVDQFIESQVGLVSKSNIERWLNSLTSFHNRHSKSIYSHQVTSWLKKELEISDYKDKDKIKMLLIFIDSQKMESNLKILFVKSRVEQINLFLSVDIMILYWRQF